MTKINADQTGGNGSARRRQPSVIVEVAKAYILRSGRFYLPPTPHELRATLCPFSWDVTRRAIDELAAAGLVRLEPRGCGGLEVIAVDPVMHAVPASVAAAAPTWCEAQP